MNIVKKYWASVYVYILLLVPCLCMCAGIFWTIFKYTGHYEGLSWIKIIIFDCSQIFYLSVSLFVIGKNKQDSSFIHRNLNWVKCFVIAALFVQYNFILYLFPSTHVWECTFLFFAIIVFFFDTKLTIINLLSYHFSLLVAHIREPELFLPMEAVNLGEIIAFRIIIIELTTFCIFVIVYFAEHFLMHAREQSEENMHLVKKQLEYYRDMELFDTEIRKFRHDINNHFICMESLLDSGSIIELKEYFSDLKKSDTVQQKMYLSGNEIIDAILHYDLPRNCNDKVEVKIQGCLSDIKTVSSMDLSTVFSNLLSNAIEAANKSSEAGASKIDIQFSCGQKFFSIGISNTVYDGCAQKHNRKDKNHGFGLRKIKEVLEKYNGKMEKSLEGDTIDIKIYLPI